MKRLALVLVALNLGLLAWFLTAPPESAPTIDSAGGERLIRLAELPSPPGPRAAMAEGQLPSGVAIPEEAEESLAQVPTLASPQTPAASRSICFQVSGYPDERSALRSKALLEKSGAQVGAPRAHQVDRSRYWVLLPPFASPAQAKATMERLKKAGVKDYYLIPNGENRNALSLGVFSTREAARRRMNDVANLKLKVRVEEVKFPTRRFSLDVAWQGSPPSRWEEALPEGSEASERECQP